MVLFEANTHHWRRWIGMRGIAFNVLRLCARRAYTVYELSEIRLRDAPGLSRSVSDVLSDINVSVVVGESERRELLVTVGTVPDPATSGGVTYLLRTTLLAFLLSPALAYAEPDAYKKYLRAWAALPQTRKHFTQLARTKFPDFSQEELLALYELIWRASLIFPRYLSSHWLVAQESPNLDPQLDLTLEERKRVVGEFFVTDIKTLEECRGEGVVAPFGVFMLGQGISQHAGGLLDWLVSSDRERLEKALRASQTWAARKILWELKHLERRARTYEAPLGWSSEEPPVVAVQPGRFSFCL